MVADCLTKIMKEDFLVQVLLTNHWNYMQTAEAKAVKVRKQTQRSTAKEDKKVPRGPPMAADADVSESEHGDYAAAE